ncbi:MAG TPA: hypothetical protein VL916_14475, partial [Ilumatobacteraceae bacterium]|nr:hypothetical protein [Ilumatobacteraceae bacterium]
EARAANDGGDMVLADGNGTVTEVSGDSVTIEYDGRGKKIYRLAKFRRSRSTTWTSRRSRSSRSVPR